MGYTVQARDIRFLVCSKPFNPRRTVLYTIIDRAKGVRGPENLVFGFGAETREQCEEMLKRLSAGDTEVSRRRSAALRVRKVEVRSMPYPAGDIDPAETEAAWEVARREWDAERFTGNTEEDGIMNVFGVLGVTFVVLKLVGVIGWSWWLVTLPFWGGSVIVFAFSLWVVMRAERQVRSNILRR